MKLGSGFIAVAAFETGSVLEDRRYLVGLVLQTILLALLVPLLIRYAEDVSEGGDVLSSRAEGFAPVGVWGEKGSLFETMLREERRLRLAHLGSEGEAEAGLESGRFCMIVGVPGEPEMTVRSVVNERDPRSASAMAILELVCASYERIQQRSLLQDVLAGNLVGTSNLTDEQIQEQVGSLVDAYLRPLRLRTSTIYPASPTRGNAGEQSNSTESPLPEGTDGVPAGIDVDAGFDEGRFLSLVFLAFGLFFPLLSSSGILIESVTGEKERRTVEALLGSPTSHRDILLGKFSSAFLLSSLQVLALLLLLAGLIRVHNIPGVAGCILVISLAVLSAATLVSTVCMGSKEVNLAATILYVLIFVVFLGPLLLPGAMAWMSPFTPLVRLAAGGSVDWAVAAAPILASILFSVISMLVSLRLFVRDDFLFGPRPSFRVLLGSWVEHRTAGFRSQALWVAGMGACATVPAIIFPSLFLLPSVAFFGEFGFFGALVFAGFVEEYFKPYGIYVLSSRLTSGRLVLLGIVSGFSFSCVENVLFTVALHGTGVLRGSLILTRYCLAPLVHIGLSVVVVLGHSRGRGAKILALTAASFTHALYNIMALLLVV